MQQGPGFPALAPISADFSPPAEAVARLEPLGVPLARLSGTLRRHYLVVLLTLLLGVGGTTAVVLSLPRQFTSEATLLIEPRRTQVSDLQAISSAQGDAVSLIRTQMDILNSTSLLMSVVRSLNLQHDPAFMRSGGGLMTMLSAYFHQVTRLRSPPSPPLSDQQKITLAAGILAGKIGFANEERSNVLRVLVTTYSPALSASIANEIARQYLEFKREEKFSAMQRASDWFQAQLTGLANQVHEAEAAVERYRIDHGLIDLPNTETNTVQRPLSVPNQQLDQVAAQLSQASRDLSEKEAQLAQARAALSNHDLGSLPEVLVSPVIAELVAQESQVSAQAARLAANQGASNPELIASRAQMQRVQGRIAAQMRNIVQGLDRQVRSARAQEAALRQRMEELRQNVGQENAAEMGMQGLLAKAHATRSLYDSFLTRATELANVTGIQEPDASLVSRATPSLTPSAPPRARLIMAAVILSLVLGTAFACLIERLRSGFGSRDQLEACLGMDVVGIVPAVRPRVWLKSPRGRATRRFEASLDNIRGHLQSMAPARPKVLMISSALPQEGKSVLAAAIATNAARAGWRVLLLECDFRRPFVARRFKLSSSPGLSDILAGGLIDTATSSAASPVEVKPRLFVLPAGSGPADPQELLASGRMVRLLAEYRHEYDLVILDTPPVVPVSDALVLSRHADATMLVVRWEKTPRVAVQDAVSLLRRSRATFLGAVLTRADTRRAARSGGRPANLYDYGGDYCMVRNET